MLKWALIVLGAFVALVASGYIRNSYLPRRHLRKFLLERGVDFVRIRYSPSYGWPGYVVVFDSIERRSAFRESATFEALLGEVQTMHGNLEHGSGPIQRQGGRRS